ncbi:hypothetical protein [Kribbella sp. CA-294648]|uniref:hypothetical protein n=1 Tax=Kribbella sp. CA-294648 TaxID=3239948 RepID=UPI003D919E22
MTGDLELQKLRWSIRRVIELLDEGIDSAGEQLARSESRLVWRGPMPADDEIDAGPGMGL